MKIKFYNPYNILKEKADYSVVFGKRSNGKSFSFKSVILFGYHEHGIDINGYLDDGSQGAMIRRMEEDFKKGRGASVWSDITDNQLNGNILQQKTNGKWNHIKYYVNAWYLCKIEDGKDPIVDQTPFCYAFALNSAEHYKSNQYPRINNIFLDEFIATIGYLVNEFSLFMSIVSTIKRQRDNIKIYMCGNSINMVNPYFTEMGLINAKRMKKNTIDNYSYGESPLKVSVEYTGDIDDGKDKEKKKADRYFAFNNPRLKMVTNGDWELDIYPHLPYKYKPKDIIYTYFIHFENEIFQCEIIDIDDRNEPFTYIHRKTTPIKEDETSIIYTQGYSTKPNYKRKIIHALSNIEKKIVWFFQNDKVFYQNNEVGNMIDNYIEWCRSSK